MNEWLTNLVKSTLTLPLRARWRELSGSAAKTPSTGIVTGLGVSVDSESPTITVHAGSGVVCGVTFSIQQDLQFPLDGISDNLVLFVLVRAIQRTDSAVNSLSMSVWYRRYATYEIVVQTEAAYESLDSETRALYMCLARVHWSVAESTVSVPSTGASYPVRVLALYSDLAEVDTEAGRARARLQDIVAVVAQDAPTIQNKTAVRLYRMSQRIDPVVVTVTDPVTTTRIRVSGLWVRNPAFNTIPPTSEKPFTVACLVRGVTVYPADADIPTTRSWVRMRDADSDTVSYITGTPKFIATVTSHEDIHGREVVPGLAQQVSSADFRHRNQIGAGSHTPVSERSNPHRLSFNDVTGTTGSGSQVPLLKQLFNEGFAVSKESVPGVIGTFTEQATEGCNVHVDWFGTRTGIRGNKYIVTEHVPRLVSYVRNTETGAEIAHQLIRGVVSLGADFIGGSFSTYPLLVPNLVYGVGDVVAVVVAGHPITSSDSRRLYRCVSGYIGTLTPVIVSGTGELTGYGAACFQELMRPTEIVVGYTYVADAEYETEPVGSTFVRIRTNPDIALISQGTVIDPDTVTPKAVSTFSLGNYKSILGIKDLTLSLTSDSEIIASQAICDRARLQDRTGSRWTASGTGLGNAIPVFATNRQVKITCLGTPEANYYLPVHGTVSVAPASRSAFAGTVKLLYVFGTNAGSCSVLNTAGPNGLYLDPSVGPFDTTTAQLVNSDNEIIPRDFWAHDRGTGKVYLSDSVFREQNSYMFQRDAYESKRNQAKPTSVTGTRKLVGKPAIALICVRKNAFITDGDSVTVTCSDSESGTVLRVQKTAVTTGSPTQNQFLVAPTDAPADMQRTATALADALNNDPAFQDAGFTATTAVAGTGEVARYYVNIATPAGARFNTEAAVTVSSPSNGLLLKQVFRGGLDPVWSFDDLVGMELRISDAIPQPDTDCYWSVFCTGDISSGASPDVFYRIAYIDASMPSDSDIAAAPTRHTLSYTVTAEDVADAMSGDSIDISSEFSVSITVTGTDSAGAAVSETLTVDRDVFTDCLDPNANSDRRWVRMQSLVTRVDSWVVNDATGIGDAEIVIVAESGADAGSCFSLCKLDWSGHAITAIEDTRVIVNSRSRNNASALAIGEALTHTSVLLRILK